MLKNWSFLNTVDPLIWIQENSKGHRFLEFASRRLPELRQCLQGNFEEIPQDDIEKAGIAAISAIRKSCTCSKHQFPEDRNSQICLKCLADVIVIFLWITLVTEIDDEIYPSITGLSNLYKWQYKMGDRYEEDIYASLAPKSYPLRQIELVFHVLSGLSPEGSYGLHQTVNQPNDGTEGQPPRSHHLALVGAGICVYHCALETPNLPPELITKLRCVRGYIAYSGARFSDLRGLSTPNHFPQQLGIIETFRNLSIETVVQENENETQLELAYLLRYTDSSDVHKSWWLNLNVLFQELYALIRVIRCTCQCVFLDEPIWG